MLSDFCELPGSLLIAFTHHAITSARLRGHFHRLHPIRELKKGEIDAKRYASHSFKREPFPLVNNKVNSKIKIFYPVRSNQGPLESYFERLRQMQNVDVLSLAEVAKLLQ